MNAIQKKQLKLLMQGENFDALMALYLEVTEKWKDTKVKRENEFETIWAMARAEGKIDGLKEFFDLFEQESQ